MRTKEELDRICALGSGKTEYKSDYDAGLLERFENRFPDEPYLVKLLCPEFTALCPKTGQPDFARIVIRYIPQKYLVESKSLKLYLFSFRNHGDFHEDVVNIIKNDLVALLDPLFMEVVGQFNPRGGISIHPTATHIRPGLWLDSQIRKLIGWRWERGCRA